MKCVSVLVLLVVPVAAQVSAELAGHALGGFPWFQHVRSINVDRSVECGLDPSRVPVAVGQAFDAYVVASRTGFQWIANPALVDVRPGGATAMTVVPGGLRANTFLLAGPNTLNATPVAGSFLGIGYDIVLDMDQDGVLGSGDLIDGYGGAAGFYLCHDTTLPGPYPVSTANYIGQPPPFLWNSKRVYFPGIPFVGQHPLVVISHGWTHDYTWYDHIAQHLASYGYIVMSHQNNVGNGDALGTETASSSVIDNIEQFISLLGSIGGGVLQGHVDTSRMVWIGHSTGGEAVTRAVTRMRNDNLPTNFFDIDDIALIVALAPVAWLTNDRVNPAETPYHTFLGAADIDTSGAPLNTTYKQTLSIFERAYGPRSLTYIHGCGHEWLHNGGAPSGCFCAGPSLIGEAATHKVLLGGSPFATQIRADVGVLRTLLITLFFGSIGMVGDVSWIINNLPAVLGVVAAILVGKSAVIWGVLRRARLGNRHALAVGVCLAQVGEFSFVLATAAEATVLDTDLFRLVVSVTIVTLLLTPALVAGGPSLIFKMAARTRSGTDGDAASDETVPRGQAVVIGFGPAGQAAAAALLQANVPTTVVDLNPRSVARARELGCAGVIGDATHQDVLEHAHVEAAAAVVVTVPDPASTQTLVALVRGMAPHATVLARCRYHVWREAIVTAGAQVVLDEEQEVGARLAEELDRLISGGSTVQAG